MQHDLGKVNGKGAACTKAHIRSDDSCMQCGFIPSDNQRIAALAEAQEPFPMTRKRAFELLDNARWSLTHKTATRADNHAASLLRDLAVWINEDKL